MEVPVHPMDAALTQREWRRARLEDLQDGSAKLAARVFCRALNIPPSMPPLMAVIDVHLWLQGNNVRMDLARPEVPSFLEELVVQGQVGVSPYALGLVPCRHEPWHWNPFSLPLIWRQEMNCVPHINAFAQHYVRSMRDTSWQCPDAAHLLR